MFKPNAPIVIGIILLTILAAWVVWPQNPAGYLPGFLGSIPGNPGIHLRIGDWSFDRQGMRLGLDLQGGTDLVLQADLSKVSASERSSAMKGVVQVIERRINAFGVAEPLIQTQGEDRVSVQLPGVKDINEAKKLIGQTAQLDFRELVTTPEGTTDWVVAKAKGNNGEEKELTGQYFKPNAQVVLDQQTGQPQVAFEWNDEGAKMFEEITGRLVGRQLGIFLDNQMISAPTVKSVIGARGVIDNIPLAEAQTLAIQLNAGALPVPVSIVKEQDVDATLGADSVRKSVLAGEIGLGIVALFMLLHYRLPGLLADVALLIYALVLLTIFKLVPVTLTLAGIAGFILSIGMAVDANILIFERMKEELRSGRTISAAIDVGFRRAWTSIRDSNISTLITCAILYWFGSNFGATIVMGFALTLAIGVIVSMLTAIIVTQTFLHLVLRSNKVTQHRWLFSLFQAPSAA